MSMNYLNAKEVMAFLLSRGINAVFENDYEDTIYIRDGGGVVPPLHRY